MAGEPVKKSTDRSALNKMAPHLDLDDDAINALRATGLTPKDMLGVAFLAKATGRSVIELVAIRKQGKSWTQVSEELGCPLDFETSIRGEESEA
jgi:hypothetical protein